MDDSSPHTGKSSGPDASRARLKKKILNLRKKLQQAEESWLEMGGPHDILPDSPLKSIASRKEFKRLKFLSENMAQLIWIVRSDGHPEYFNKRFFRYTGYTLRELKRHRWQQTIHPDDLEESIRLWKESLQQGKSCELEYRLKNATTQTYRWHLVRSIPMSNDQGQIICWVSSATDIHERKLQSEQIEEKNHQLSRINQYLDDLVHATAHDMRVPVARLQLLVESFHELTAQQRQKVLPKISRSVHHLDTTLKGLIQVMDIHSYPEKFKQNIPLKRIVRQVLDRKQESIQRVKARVNIEDEGNCKLSYVKSYLYTIIDNIISNAIKCSKTDQPLKLDILLKRQQGYCVMIFSDNGIGINLNRYQEQIFLPFRKIHQEIDGMGLGLYITQSILQKNGGHIEVNSEPDKGSVFKIFLKEYY